MVPLYCSSGIRPMDPSSFHEHEGDAVREADTLIVVLFEKNQGIVFFRFVRTENVDQIGFVDTSDPLSCKATIGTTP
jgi:hypothetical protein